MKLINGKFYQDGKEVPLEFGNTEQIKLIKEAEDRAEYLKGEGLEPDITEIDEDGRNTTVYISFTCICGTEVQFEEQSVEMDNPDDLDDYLYERNPLYTQCTCCKKRYKTEVDDEWGCIVVKLK